MGSLLAKEAPDQWSPEIDIDWQLPIRYPFWFRKRTYVKTISQFYHGERATQQVCRRLISEIDNPTAKSFLKFQLADEEKHEAVFQRYIQSMGEIAPIEPAMKRALEGSLSWQGSKYGSSIGLIVSFHIVFESGALMLLERLVPRFPCPLFRAINAKVMADEARHIAFGLRFVRQHVAELSDEERRAIYAHVAQLWLECARAAQSRYSMPVAMVTRIGSNWLLENWQRQKKQLFKIGLITPDEAYAIEETFS